MKLLLTYIWVLRTSLGLDVESFVNEKVFGRLGTDGEGHDLQDGRYYSQRQQDGPEIDCAEDGLKAHDLRHLTEAGKKVLVFLV